MPRPADKISKFPFRGLSYTNFTLTEQSSAAMERVTVPETLSIGDNTTVTLSVKNIGARDGDEVIMALFVPHAGVVPASAPAARLRQQMFAFERLGVRAHSAAALSFSVTPDELALYSAAGDRMIFPGRYSLKFTNGVDQHVVKQIQVSTPTGAPVVREKWLA
jgi:hypothetical protein